MTRIRDKSLDPCVDTYSVVSGRQESLKVLSTLVFVIRSFYFLAPLMSYIINMFYDTASRRVPLLYLRVSTLS